MAPVVAQNRITLRNLKVFGPGSEETLCFTATLLLDGNPIAYARNDGHGGETALSPLESSSRAHLAEAQAFAKQLPPFVDEVDGVTTPLPMSLDFLIRLIASDMDLEQRLRRTFRRAMSSKVLYIRGNELLFCKSLSPKRARDAASLYQNLRQQHGAEVILAELPTEEAYVIWKSHVVTKAKP